MTRRSDEKGRNEAAAAAAAAGREIIGEVAEEADEHERRRAPTGRQTDATLDNQMPGG